MGRNVPNKTERLKNMKKITSIILSLMMVVSLISMGITVGHAQDMSGDLSETIHWELDENGVLTISGYGSSSWYGSFANRDDIKEVVFEEGIVSLGANDFENCSNLVKVHLPRTMTVIDRYMFWNCSSLSEVNIEDTVVEIGDGAFFNCSSYLGDLILPDSIIKIGDAAFSKNSTAGDVYDGPKYRLKLPNKLEYLGQLAFEYCDQFVGDIILPDTLTYIGGSAFYHCQNFDGVLKLSENLSSLGRSTFEGCYNLKGDLTIPESITTIGQYCFMYCGLDGDLILHDGITEIDACAFQGCGFTNQLHIPTGLSKISNYCFSGVPFSGELLISDNISEIGDGAFSNCSFVGDLVIPYSVKKIGGYAFSGCQGFSNPIYVPETVEEIGDGAFRNNLDIDCSDSSVAEQWCINSHYFVSHDKVYTPIWHVIYLAQNSDGELVDVSKLDEDFDISETYLCDGASMTTRPAFYSWRNFKSGKNYKMLTLSVWDTYRMNAWSYWSCALSDERIFNAIPVDGNGDAVLNKNYAKIDLTFEENNDAVLVPNYQILSSSDGANAVILTGIYDEQKPVSVYAMRSINNRVFSVPVASVISSSGNSEQAIVTLTTETANLRVTVPTVLPVSVDSDNNVTVSDQAKIVNYSKGQVDVTNAVLSGNNSWTLAAFDTDFKKVPVDAKQYGFKLQGYSVPVNGNAYNNQFDTIDGGAALDLSYDANVAIQSEATKDAEIGNIVFTVAWHK